MDILIVLLTKMKSLIILLPPIKDAGDNQKWINFNDTIFYQNC